MDQLTISKERDLVFLLWFGMKSLVMPFYIAKLYIFLHLLLSNYFVWKNYNNNVRYGQETPWVCQWITPSSRKYQLSLELLYQRTVIKIYITVLISGFGVPSSYRSSLQRIPWIWFCHYGNYWRCRALYQVFESFSAWRSIDHSGKGIRLH